MRGFLLLLSCFLIGCDSSFFRLPPSRVTSIPRPGNDSQESSSTTSSQNQWGVVRCPEKQANLFNQHIKRFLSTTLNAQAQRSLEYIRCRKSNNHLQGGFWIRGTVNFENGEYYQRNSFTQQLDVSENSFLEIHIVDIYNKVLAQIRMQAIPYAGGVNGNHIALAFSDSKGKVLLDGTVKDGLFSGPFVYENFTTWEGGSRGYRGEMGFFVIPVCSLLNCSTPVAI